MLAIRGSMTDCTLVLLESWANFRTEGDCVASIHVQGIAIRFVFILFSSLHGLLKFLLKNPVTILHRAELLRKNLLPHLFLFVQSLYHLIKRGKRPAFFLVGDKRARLRSDCKRGLATRADDCEPRCVCHSRLLEKT